MSKYNFYQRLNHFSPNRIHVDDGLDKNILKGELVADGTTTYVYGGGKTHCKSGGTTSVQQGTVRLSLCNI